MCVHMYTYVYVHTHLELSLYECMHVCMLLVAKDRALAEANGTIGPTGAAVQSRAMAGRTTAVICHRVG